MDYAAHIVLLLLDISIPAAQSLKAKRRVLKGVKDRVRANFNAAVAEIGELDKWQRALVGVTMLGNDKRRLEREAALIVKQVFNNAEALLLDYSIEFI